MLNYPVIVIGERSLSAPPIDCVLQRRDFAVRWADAFSKAVSSRVPLECIGCFLQDNRQTALTYPNAAGDYGLHSRPTLEPHDDRHGHPAKDEAAVVMSFLFPLRKFETSPTGESRQHGLVAVVPFNMASDTPATNTVLLSYDLRLDLKWAQQSDATWRCLICLRRFVDNNETISDSPLSLNLEVFCEGLRSIWASDEPLESPPAVTHGNDRARFTFDLAERKRLESAVSNLKDAIASGQFYLANLTTITECPTATISGSVVSYLQRWCQSPSRFGWFVKTHPWTIESYSPERFFRIVGDRIQTEPIKGTRRLMPDCRRLDEAPTPDTHWQVAWELWNSEKERCEQHLVTDLLRNDLASVCQPGTVQVVSPLEIRFCSGLAQMTSVIGGVLRPGLSLQDLLLGLLPAGSVTGAPKRAVCQALKELESQPRGLYCGLCIDVESPSSLDATLLIRTLFGTGSKVWAGTGAGITALSCPEEEVSEMEVKLTSFLARCS